MNNSIIDNRRIHCDFSQSVSKMNTYIPEETKQSIYGHGLQKKTKYRNQQEDTKYDFVHHDFGKKRQQDRDDRGHTRFDKGSRHDDPKRYSQSERFDTDKRRSHHEYGEGRRSSKYDDEQRSPPTERSRDDYDHRDGRARKSRSRSPSHRRY